MVHKSKEGCEEWVRDGGTEGRKEAGRPWVKYPPQWSLSSVVRTVGCLWPLKGALMEKASMHRTAHLCKESQLVHDCHSRVQDFPLKRSENK